MTMHAIQVGKTSESKSTREVSRCQETRAALENITRLDYSAQKCRHLRRGKKLNYLN
jgi:hypothetical protein